MLTTELRLRGSAFHPQGPWTVTRTDRADDEVLGSGRTPREAVDAALLRTEAPRG